MEIDGQTMEGGSAQVVVKGERFATTSMGAAYEGVVEVDGSTEPKQFNLVFSAGPEKGNTNLGIYELDRDTWRICLNTTGGERPVRFATAPGSGLALETLARGPVRARKTAPAAAETAPPSTGGAAPEGDPAPELAGEWSMASCVLNGGPLEAEFLSYGRRTATATEVTVKMGPQTMLQAAYRVDRSTTPHQMNYLLAHGPHKGKTQHGIYRLVAGTLETCFAPPGAARPADFSSTAGDGRTLTVWQASEK